MAYYTTKSCTWTFACFRRPLTGARTSFPCLRFATSSSWPSVPPWCLLCRPWCPAASWTGCRWETAWHHRPSPCGSPSHPCWGTLQSIRACCDQTTAWEPSISWWLNVGDPVCRALGPWSTWPRTPVPWQPHRPLPDRSTSAPAAEPPHKKLV